MAPVRRMANMVLFVETVLPKHIVAEASLLSRQVISIVSKMQLLNLVEGATSMQLSLLKNTIRGSVVLKQAFT